MRRLTILVFALALIYSGYWFIGAGRVENGARAALAQMQTEGWDTGTTTVSTRGFPSRFDTTLGDVALSAPDGTFAVETPFVQAFALSYRPTQVIVALAETLNLRLGLQEISIAASGARASAAVSAGPALPLKDITAEVPEATLQSSFGWTLGLTELLFAVRPAPRGDLHYDLYLGTAALSPQTGPALTDIVFDATIRLDRALDRHLLADVAPLIETLDVNAVQLVWDRTRLSGQGTLLVDAAGVPQGEVMLNIDGWQDLVPMLVDAGLLAPNMRFTMQAIMQNLAGEDDLLALPLMFDAGRMQLGPIPLGPAPKLR